MKVCDACKKPGHVTSQEILATRDDGGRTSATRELCNDCWLRAQQALLNLENLPDGALLKNWKSIANVSKLINVEEVVSKLVEPPCRICQNWRPHVRYNRGRAEELKCCTAPETYTDFSCFEARP